MRILLVADHRYPAYSETGVGLHPKQFPSGSAYHLHDLLAQGLAEEGHEVFYQVKGGADLPLPRGVQLVSAPVADVDICHAPVGPPGFSDQIVEFGARFRKPYVLTCHMVREGIPAAPTWVFVSRAHADNYGSDRIVLNGIDPQNYIFSETKDDYLLFMGAMDKAINKGLDLALALARRKGMRLIVAGTGRDYPTIAHISELCAEAGAEYAGDVRGSRKAELLAGARALLFPSRMKEGCPVVILEAMISGTPVISSNAGGSVELVTPETGFLCDRAEQWDEAVDQLSRISPARCRAVALDQYHYRRMVKDYVREYQQEIGSFAG